MLFAKKKPPHLHLLLLGYWVFLLRLKIFVAISLLLAGVSEWGKTDLGEAGLRTATPPPPVALHLFSSWARGGG